MTNAHLGRRAELLHALRGFFREQGFLEVGTPIALPEAIPERHIDPVAAGERWLQASPELAMKRLVCAGVGSIFQVAKCFRNDERGPLHAPEFTMVEWYRPGDDMLAGIDLLDDLMQTLLRTQPAIRTSYRTAFTRSLGLDPHHANVAELRSCAMSRPGVPDPDVFADDRDEWLNLLLATAVEPMLGREAPEIVFHYPATQAALARTTTDEFGERVAERFELYWRGVELANGYRELTDPAELRDRLVAVKQARQREGLPTAPLPGSLLADMERLGLPESCGVALGFDRLVMLAVGAESVWEVIAG